MLLEGLTDRARRPHRYANQLPEQIEAAIVAAKREKPDWGARKIGERLLRPLPHAVKVPARSTIRVILDRHGLVSRAKRSRTHTAGTPLSEGFEPNALWCTDYRGEFMLGDSALLLSTDGHRSCFALSAALRSHGIECRKDRFYCLERLFKERGLPHAIRSDNGVPFASPNGLFNLSRLSVWWLRLGIASNGFGPAIPNRMAGTSACV